MVLERLGMPKNSFRSVVKRQRISYHPLHIHNPHPPSYAFCRWGKERYQQALTHFMLLLLLISSECEQRKAYRERINKRHEMKLLTFLSLLHNTTYKLKAKKQGIITSRTPKTIIVSKYIRFRYRVLCIFLYLQSILSLVNGNALDKIYLLPVI
ncbi:unnamed protein product [Orchesella dallaii]|uniref:Uncharacterized protein n=1 Tax=Orchesella dallaii TaxID=48710 RepID=A0ABP1PJT5_9HEXA